MTTVKIPIVVNIFDRYNKKIKWAGIFQIMTVILKITFKIFLILLSGQVVGVNEMLNLAMAGMTPIVAIGIDTQGVEGRWRFVKDIGKQLQFWFYRD